MKNTDSSIFAAAVNPNNASRIKDEEGENCDDKLRMMFSQSFFLEEIERRHFAEAIHEKICQTLAISRIKLGALRQQSSSGNCHKTLDEIYGYIDGVIQEMRSLVFELSPLVLYELGFEKAIESLVEKLEKDYHIPIIYQIKPGPKPDVTLEILLFRALRELLLNAIIHASPRQIKVFYENKDGDIRIDVVDDGVGFEVGKIFLNSNGQERFGIVNIQEKLKHLNGQLKITSSPGDGAHFSILLNSKNPACQTLYSSRATASKK